MYIFLLEYAFCICLLYRNRFFSFVVDTVLHTVGIQYLFAETHESKDEYKKRSEKTMICSLIDRKQLCQTIIVLRNDNT